MEELQHAATVLGILDEHPHITFQFYNKEPENIRYAILNDHVTSSIVNSLQMKVTNVTREMVEKRRIEIERYLDTNFHSQEWPCHESHFHTDFQHYLSCPFLTLQEVVQVFKKV